MASFNMSILTICGLEELTEHRSRGVTHVLSILDPGSPDPDAFTGYDLHRRTVLRFHDAIEPLPGLLLPTREDVEAVLSFGSMLATAAPGQAGHLLVHCHAGISRSTAAMAMLMAQASPREDEDSIMQRVLTIRSKAWPNSRMVDFADDLLGRGGRLLRAAGRVYRRQLTALPHLAQFMRENGRVRELELAAE
jgi:predicted protein tyrosine phosphatase